MCIIAIKPKGVEATDEFFNALLVAAGKNQDGLGFALKKDGEDSIKMLKGMYQEKSFIEYIKKQDIQKDDELMFHARMGTSGYVDAENCHPFVISSEDDIIGIVDAEKLRMPVLAHNGIFSDFSHVRKDFSDTYSFVKDVVATSFGAQLIEHCIINTAIEKMIFNYNKVGIMFPQKDRNIAIFGTFENDFDGCLFSNSMYKEYKTVRETDYYNENFGGYGY